MIVTIEDLRQQARRRLPRAVFDFIDGGAEDERTLRANRAAFQRYTFRPRVLVDVAERDQSTSVLGVQLATPLILAPTGLCGMATPRGELAAARAAASRGALFTLSTMAACTIEEVARVTSAPLWFQLYIWRDRALTRELVARASTAGYRALMVTVDTQVIGQRERDLRNGFTIPPRVTLGNLLDTLQKLAWVRRMLTSGPPTFKNVVGAAGARGRNTIVLGAYVNQQFDPAITWRDLDWLRGLWSGPMLIKGIMSAADARRAVEQYGVEGIVVSNHGGRQLDGLPGALDVLPEVVEAVGGRAEIILDGGVRRGADVVKAVALGAKACMIGRPYLYGLAAAGQAGVELALDILRAEIDRVLALIGRPRRAELDVSALNRPARRAGQATATLRGA